MKKKIPTKVLCPFYRHLFLCKIHILSFPKAVGLKVIIRLLFAACKQLAIINPSKKCCSTCSINMSIGYETSFLPHIIFLLNFTAIYAQHTKFEKHNPI